VSLNPSESVPETVYVPASGLPVTVTSPELETERALEGVGVTKLTGPMAPSISSWALKFALEAVAVVPEVGTACVIVDASTVSV
jgi:hypothetical protein